MSHSSRRDSDSQTSGNTQPPQDLAARVDWFVNSTVEESQELADFHGDATAHRRDQR